MIYFYTSPFISSQWILSKGLVAVWLYLIKQWQCGAPGVCRLSGGNTQSPRITFFFFLQSLQDLRSISWSRGTPSSAPVSHWLPQHPEEVTSEKTQVLSWELMQHWKGKWVEGLCAGEGRFPYNHQLLAWDALFTTLPLKLLLKDKHGHE